MAAVDRLIADMDDSSPGAESLHRMMSNVRSSYTCLCLYMALMVFSMLVMILEIRGGLGHWELVVMESFINFFLVLEKYFFNWVNVVDLLVTVLCLVFFALFIQENGPLSKSWDVSSLNSVLLGLRYIFQLSRVVILVYRSKPTRKFFTQDNVEFVRDMPPDLDDTHMSHLSLSSSPSAEARLPRNILSLSLSAAAMERSVSGGGAGGGVGARAGMLAGLDDSRDSHDGEGEIDLESAPHEDPASRTLSERLSQHTRGGSSGGISPAAVAAALNGGGGGGGGQQQQQHRDEDDADDSGHHHHHMSTSPIERGAALFGAAMAGARSERTGTSPSMFATAGSAALGSGGGSGVGGFAQLPAAAAQLRASASGEALAAARGAQPPRVSSSMSQAYDETLDHGDFSEYGDGDGSHRL